MSDVVTARVHLRDAEGSEDMATTRALFEEYAASIGVDLCFQGLAEELASLPGAYARPGGCLLLAERGEALGCVALRPLTAGIGEVKRLYVRPAARGEGVGAMLARAVIERAGICGYRELKLDTLQTMTTAHALYAALGFRPCAPYYDNPLPGVTYMSLALSA
jgi:GNAT superfamily N-acetyltransferase